jgi:dTDP-4-amino-4,6-dideoxygalactose transaminase
MKMIPRHQPAYTWRQWNAARSNSRSLPELEAAVGARLCERLNRRHALFYRRGRDVFYAWFSVIDHGRTAIVPAFTCCVVPEAIRNAGSPLVFADVDSSTYNMEPENLDGLACPPRPVVVMTHQWGLPSRADGILAWARANGALVFEDSAAALGAEYQGRPCGSFGDVSVISFENTKLLGAGDLGVLLTDDDGVADRLRENQETFADSEGHVARGTALLKMVNSETTYRPVFKLWSWREGDYYGDHGVQRARDPAYYQQRPDPFALALVLEQWDDIDQRINHRRRLMAIYRDELGEAATCSLNSRSEPCPIRQPLRVNDKRSFFEAMFRQGTDLGWSFDYTVLPGEQETHFPHAVDIASHVLNLPIHEGVTERKAREIARQVKKVLAREPHKATHAS